MENNKPEANSFEDSESYNEKKKIYEVIQNYSLALAAAREQYISGEIIADEMIASLLNEWSKFAEKNPELAEKALWESFDVTAARPLLFGKKDKTKEEQRLAKRLRTEDLFRDTVEENFMSETFLTTFGSDEFLAEVVSIEELQLAAKLIKTRENIDKKYRKDFTDSLSNGIRLLLKKNDSFEQKSNTVQNKDDDTKQYQKMIETKLHLLKENFPKLFKAGEDKYKADDQMHALFVKRSLTELSEKEVEDLLKLGEKYPDVFDEAIHASTFYNEFARGAYIHANIEGALEKAVTALNRHPKEMIQEFFSGKMNPAQAFNFFQIVGMAEDKIPKQEIIEEFEAHLTQEGLDKKEKQKYGIISGEELPERIFRWFMKVYMGKPYEGFQYFEEESE